MTKTEERAAQYRRYAELRGDSVNDYSVAKKTGIPMSTFTDWKNGRSAPKIGKLLLIAKALKVGVTKLL